MKRAPEIAKETVEGKGQVALFLYLVLGVIGLWIFPVPAAVYIYYLGLLSYAQYQAWRWLQQFLTTWPRLIACGVVGLGLVAGAWQLPPLGRDWSVLHPLTFTYCTLIWTGTLLFAEAWRWLWKINSVK